MNCNVLSADNALICWLEHLEQVNLLLAAFGRRQLSYVPEIKLPVYFTRKTLIKQDTHWLFQADFY